jgi:hypothetical protein
MAALPLSLAVELSVTPLYMSPATEAVDACCGVGGGEVYPLYISPAKADPANATVRTIAASEILRFFMIFPFELNDGTGVRWPAPTVNPHCRAHNKAKSPKCLLNNQQV